MTLVQNPEFWVGVGLLLFLALLVVLNVPKAAASALDARGRKIKAALDEAQRLRDEAAALLASIKARRETTEAQAVEMLKEAELEAKRLESEALAKLEEQIARRSALADRRIALAEAQAAQEVKAAAVELAARLAEERLAARAAEARADPLVDSAIDELPTRFRGAA